MKKKFNITGLCYPNQHYMMDVEQKMREVIAFTAFTIRAYKFFFIFANLLIAISLMPKQPGPQWTNNSILLLFLAKK